MSVTPLSDRVAAGELRERGSTNRKMGEREVRPYSAGTVGKKGLGGFFRARESMLTATSVAETTESEKLSDRRSAHRRRGLVAQRATGDEKLDAQREELARKVHAVSVTSQQQRGVRRTSRRAGLYKYEVDTTVYARPRRRLDRRQLRRRRRRSLAARACAFMKVTRLGACLRNFRHRALRVGVVQRGDCPQRARGGRVSRQPVAHAPGEAREAVLPRFGGARARRMSHHHTCPPRALLRAWRSSRRAHQCRSAAAPAVVRFAEVDNAGHRLQSPPRDGGQVQKSWTPRRGSARMTATAMGDDGHQLLVRLVLPQHVASVHGRVDKRPRRGEDDVPGRMPEEQDQRLDDAQAPHGAPRVLVATEVAERARAASETASWFAWTVTARSDTQIASRSAKRPPARPSSA